MTIKKKQIPVFKSIQEEADYWDTHSLADHWDEMRPVKDKFAKPLQHVFTVRFDSKTLTDLQTEASKKGISAGTLIRMWIKERLNQGSTLSNLTKNAA
jgi:predicted DNA binding CopG/RHH family protein